MLPLARPSIRITLQHNILTFSEVSESSTKLYMKFLASFRLESSLNDALDPLKNEFGFTCFKICKNCDRQFSISGVYPTFLNSESIITIKLIPVYMVTSEFNPELSLSSSSLFYFFIYY
jgi:hypothetical protein